MIPDWVQAAIKIAAVGLMLGSFAAVLETVKRQSAPRLGRSVKLGWLYVVLGVLVSRAAILVFSLFVGSGSLADKWTRWDAVHYRDLMQQGYIFNMDTDAWLNIVFFPLYPALCRFLGGSFFSMLLVSWACMAGAAVVIARMTPAADRFWSVLWLCVFPVTVFLGAPYTESLFLLTTGLTLAAVRRRRWGLAGVFGMMAALARNLGVLTALAFVAEFLVMYWERVRKKEARWKGLVPAIVKEGGLWCLLIPFGTLLYLAINQLVYGDPFMFLLVQKEHWSQSFGFFGQTLVTSLHYSLFYEDTTYVYFLFIPQTVLLVVTLFLFPFLLRKMSVSEAVYSLAYVFCAMSPTWLLSYPRYLLGLVTLFPAMTRAVKPLWARVLLTVVFMAAMVPMTYGYLRGWPVL